MLFNWYTTGACILTEEWQIKSVGDYVGSIIGVSDGAVTVIRHYLTYTDTLSLDVA